MIKRIFLILLVITCLLPVNAFAADWLTTDGYFTVYTEEGEVLFMRGGEVSVDDEYISGDNQLYRIVSVDEDKQTAVAAWQGAEEMPSVEWLSMAFAAMASSATDGNTGDRLIAIYATHTDESYIPTDGTANNEAGAGGILDVAEALKASFEKQGIQVELDTTSHLPHDSGAYRRSRQTAVTLMKQNPDALIDIHRDGTPAEEYITEVDGENVSKVRLLVGRSNQNSAANKEFAKQIKAVADEQYPGLIKDIFIGKGSYNQELMPQAILLEMGTHTISKERAIKSAEMVATVMTSVIYGDIAQSNNQNTGATAANKSNSGISTGIIWVIVAVVIAGAVYALLATGSGRGMLEKIKRNTSEITGGLIGKKPKKDDSSDDRH